MLLERRRRAGHSADSARNGAATAANAGLTGANTNDMALIQGHGGVGVVEAVGPEVDESRSAIASACRGPRSAAPAITACADARTCANCSAVTSLAISCRSPICATARRCIRTRTSAGLPN